MFIAGAWQDEQTGGQWANLLDRFAPTTKVRAVGQNGVHTESLDPTVLAEMIEFLDFYVAQKVPTIPLAVRLIAPAIWQSITGVGRPDASRRTASTRRWTSTTALAQFESELPIRIIWEVGASPGAIAGRPGARLRRPATRPGRCPTPRPRRGTSSPAAGSVAEPGVRPATPAARPLP